MDKGLLHSYGVLFFGMLFLLRFGGGALCRWSVKSELLPHDQNLTIAHRSGLFKSVVCSVVS